MLSYTDDLIRSGITSHIAERIAVPSDSGETWVVSWMPEQRLSRNQATTAMVLAEYVANYWHQPDQVVGMEERRFRQFATQWADELGMTADDAIGWICQPNVAG